jgi:hypothetical protein
MLIDLLLFLVLGGKEGILDSEAKVNRKEKGGVPVNTRWGGFPPGWGSSRNALH